MNIFRSEIDIGDLVLAFFVFVLALIAIFPRRFLKIWLIFSIGMLNYDDLSNSDVRNIRLMAGLVPVIFIIASIYDLFR